MGEFIKVAKEGHVLIITLDRPEFRNALHAPACFELDAILNEFESDDDLWIAIFNGNGPSFCAGHDLVDGVEDPMPASGWAGLARRRDLFKPLICAVHGFVLGGGWEIALACDIVVADENAIFGLTEPRVGYAALGGGIMRVVQRMPWHAAAGLLLTGNRMDAKAAHRLGVVTEVAPAGTAMDVARRYAADIQKCSPGAIRITKEMAKATLEPHVSRDELQALSDRLVERLVSGEDVREGASAFAQKRQPVWKNR